MRRRRRNGPWRRSLAALLAVSALGVRPGIVRGAESARDANAAAMTEFDARVRAYVEQRNRLEAELPPTEPTADRAVIDTHRRTLAARLAVARASDGTVFTDRTRMLFRRLVAEAVGGTDGRGARSSILEDNPGTVAVRPNQPYPEGVPLSTVPPAVLKALPSLPTDLEYRFVGRHLILRDARANLVVDLVMDALPS